MSKKIENQEEIVVAEAVSKTEKFFEQNGKKVIIALVAFVLVFAGVFGFKVFILDKNEAAAAELMLVAQERLDGETPNYELALNGDESGAGFLEVIEQYGSTKAGNLAKHYVGTCYLRLGKFEEAAKALAEYDAVRNEPIINAQNIGLQGDVAVELEKYEEAAKLFAEAAEESNNEYTAPLYLYKQALALDKAGKREEAKACAKTIIEKYPSANEAAQAEKLLY